MLSRLTGVSATQRTEGGDLAVSWRRSGSVGEQRYNLNVTVAPGLALTTRLVLPLGGERSWLGKNFIFFLCHLYRVCVHLGAKLMV